jgi:hypothetical protein
MHLVGVSGGSIWHTIRDPLKGWDPWDEVTASAGPVVDPPREIACAFVAGVLHVCVTTAVGGLIHTIRFGKGNWQPWGDAGSVGFSTVLGLSLVGSASIGSGLVVCVDGFKRSSGTHTQSLPAVWRSDRTAAGWSAPGSVTDAYLSISDIACASVSGSELHVLARCVDRISSAELLIHTIWYPSGASQPLGDQDVIKNFPGSSMSSLKRTRTVAAAGIGQALHVVASDGIELFHTIRIDNTRWQGTFGLVRPSVDASFLAPLTGPACANDGGNLHVCAISNGAIFHTIRMSSPAGWRNPETSSKGGFGNVLGSVPPGPRGSPPQTFIDIGCCGS